MTGIPVLLALEGAPHEQALLAGLSRPGSGVAVVRRCVDLADLIAAASLGTATTAVVAAGLRRLDHEALAGLASHDVSVIAVVAADDEAAERRIRMLGVNDVVGVPTDDPAPAVQALLTVLHERGRAPAHRVPPQATSPEEPMAADGRLVAVWGPTGAPGRTTLATYLACETAQLGASTLLADVDTYGGAVAQLLGLLDESPGIAAATRAVSAGALDLQTLAQSARQVGPNLKVLTGIVRADRWPELRPAALEEVWTRARMLASLTVVDCGFCLETDEELSYDTAAPRRNGATVATLSTADVVLAVGRADPVGVQRLIRLLPDARAAAPQAELRVVLTRVRKGPITRDPQGQLVDSLRRHAGIEDEDVVLIPEDQHAYDAAMAAGLALHEVAPRSSARAAIQRIARDLHPSTPQGRRRRRGRRTITADV